LFDCTFGISRFPFLLVYIAPNLRDMDIYSTVEKFYCEVQPVRHLELP